ncbi:hypothetical protein BJ912DRAFT_983760 [Pholiota molesta]|nr:hypothetical protein BJ912DRAFT_983760 [Pholiota molesta]
MSLPTPTSYQPSKRRRVHDENRAEQVNSGTSTTSTLTPLAIRFATSQNTPKDLNSTPHSPLPTPRPPLSAMKIRPRFQNGYEVKSKTLSFTPYKVNNPGHPRQKAFAFGDFQSITAMDPLPSTEWNKLALDSGILKAGQVLRDYQVEAANCIISRSGDLCVIAPTGAGKSHTWILPLLAQGMGISLVIVPFTSLGYQGEERCGLLRQLSYCY